MITRSSPNYRHPDARLVVFAREPVLGQVKTRLQPALGEARCLALYRAMLRRIVTMATASGLAPVDLWISSNPDHEDFISLCNKRNIFIQEGEDLGRRMDFSVVQTLAREGVDRLVLIGSDCPALTPSYLADALDALEQGADVVIGPAEDGGYLLIGLKRPDAGLFEGVDWGSERVLEQTRAYLEREQKRRYCLLKTLWDLDEPQDLARLATLKPPLTY